MTYLDFVELVVKPLKLQLFPASGNAYFDQLRFCYVDFFSSTADLQINYVKMTGVAWLTIDDNSRREAYEQKIKEFKTLCTIHGIEIRGE